MKPKLVPQRVLELRRSAATNSPPQGGGYLTCTDIVYARIGLRARGAGRILFAEWSLSRQPGTASRPESRYHFLQIRLHDAINAANFSRPIDCVHCSTPIAPGIIYSRERPSAPPYRRRRRSARGPGPPAQRSGSHSGDAMRNTSYWRLTASRRQPPRQILTRRSRVLFSGRLFWATCQLKRFLKAH